MHRRARFVRILLSHVRYAHVELVAGLNEKLDRAFHPPERVEELNGALQHIVGLFHEMNRLRRHVVVVELLGKRRRLGFAALLMIPPDLFPKRAQSLEWAERLVLALARHSAGGFGRGTPRAARQVVHPALEFENFAIVGHDGLFGPQELDLKQDCREHQRVCPPIATGIKTALVLVQRELIVPSRIKGAPDQRRRGAVSQLIFHGKKVIRGLWVIGETEDEVLKWQWLSVTEKRTVTVYSTYSTYLCGRSKTWTRR